MTELEKKQLLVKMINVLAEDSEFSGHANLNLNDSTFEGLGRELNFLMRNRLELYVDEIRTGGTTAESLPKPNPGDRIYTQTELVSFGQYLLSQKRRDSIAAVKIKGVSLSERLKDVYDSDIPNWMEEIA